MLTMVELGWIMANKALLLLAQAKIWNSNDVKIPVGLFAKANGHFAMNLRPESRIIIDDRCAMSKPAKTKASFFIIKSNTLDWLTRQAKWLQKLTKSKTIHLNDTNKNRIADRFRDLPLPSSAYMAEAITSVISCSHRTIVCLTRAYLASEWCRFELRSAINELTTDKTHKIIAILLEPDCLHQTSELDAEIRSLLSAIGLLLPQTTTDIQNNNNNEQSQLVQLANEANIDGPNQLVATLTSAGRVVSSKQQAQNNKQLQHLASRASFISYQDRKFWLTMKQLMPIARPPTQTFTLTTK